MVESHDPRLDEMIGEWRERRTRSLTPADIEAIKEAIGAHQCRFGMVDAKEFNEAWPVLHDFATSVTHAKRVTLRAIAAGLAIFFLGLLTRGAWQWISDLHNRIGNVIAK